MTENAYISVETESQLNHYCQQIIDNPDISWVAIDTEFVRVDTYFAELSLVQIQDCLGQTAIIDPILITQSAVVDSTTHPLHALTALLTDANTLKVFHSARQDIEVLYQLEDKMPVSIFDTQIAALFLKHGEMAGFARVIKAELHVSIDKSQTRTNWHHRPLTPEQIEYALDDVRYLSPLYEQCLKKLTADEIAAVTQECSAMLDKILYTPAPKNAGAKVKGIKAFKAKQLAIVNTLASWREQFAVTQNQPKKWVMDDDVITNIAKRPPITVEALYKVPHIKSSSVKLYGAQWIELIDEVFQQSPEEWPQPPPKVPTATLQEEALIQLCMAYVQQVAIEYKLNLPSVANRNDILAILRLKTDEKPVLKGWRNQLIGKDLNLINSGRVSIKIELDKIVLIWNL